MNVSRVERSWVPQIAGEQGPIYLAIADAIGAALYAVFTFAWTPLHYIHLMAITLAATLGFALVGSRLMRSRTGAPPLLAEAGPGA